MTYPLQSEVSPTFRRFQGLVSCLVFSSKFTSSWGGKRKDPVNMQGKIQGTNAHKSWVRMGDGADMGYSDFAREQTLSRSWLRHAAPCTSRDTQHSCPSLRTRLPTRAGNNLAWQEQLLLARILLPSYRTQTSRWSAPGFAYTSKGAFCSTTNHSNVPISSVVPSFPEVHQWANAEASLAHQWGTRRRGAGLGPKAPNPLIHSSVHLCREQEGKRKGAGEKSHSKTHEK